MKVVDLFSGAQMVSRLFSFEEKTYDKTSRVVKILVNYLTTSTL
jgi:hypothetical protein